MARPLENFFVKLPAQGLGEKRKLMPVSSGADRSTDSGLNFIDALLDDMPFLEPLIDTTPGINDYPPDNPQPKPVGTKRFLLYFFAPDPKRDLVTDPADQYFETYREGPAYEAYLASPRYLNRMAQIENHPAYIAACRPTLERLFTKEFIDKLQAGTYQFADTGSFTFTSDDDQFSTTIPATGRRRFKVFPAPPPCSTMLYELYKLAPGLKAEAGADFSKYLPSDLASILSFRQDAEKFHMSGPGFTETNGITHRMARILVRDFFDEVSVGKCGTPPCSALAMLKHCCHWLPNSAFPAGPNLCRNTSFIPMKTVHGAANRRLRWRPICSGTLT